MDLIELLKALAHENRVRILNLLRERELCVCELENIMKINQSNVSRHLNKLRQSGIIKSKQKAQWVYYYLNEEFIKNHPFIKEIFREELDDLEICQDDNRRLKNYLKSNLTCSNLSNETIDLDKINIKRRDKI